MTTYFGEPISVYTTTQALADGVLVEAGVLAKDLFAWPVLLTQAASTDCVAWSDVDTAHTHAIGQSESGRLWDVLWMAHVAIRQRERHSTVPHPMTFKLHRIATETRPGADGEIEPGLVTLKLTIGQHDDGSPYLLISEPDED